jgi:hypothetical protein
MKQKPWWNDAKAYSGLNFGIKIIFLGQLENILKHLREFNNPKQMAPNKLIPSTMVMVEPKAKQRIRSRKEKEKNVDLEELMTLGQTMVNNELQDEEVQILKNLVDEVAKVPPRKNKKKKTRMNWASAKPKAYEKTPSHIA